MFKLSFNYKPTMSRGTYNWVRTTNWNFAKKSTNIKNPKLTNDSSKYSANFPNQNNNKNFAWKMKTEWSSIRPRSFKEKLYKIKSVLF